MYISEGERRIFIISSMPFVFANILMPVMANIGNINYVLTTIVGALLAIGNVGGLTLGGLASWIGCIVSALLVAAIYMDERGTREKEAA